MMKTFNIWWGTSENPQLSNLAKRRFSHDGYYYETVEHAYQTLKSGKFDARTYYRTWKAGTKHIGLRADRKTNIALMRTLIAKSFMQNPYALNMLMDIDVLIDKPLLEGMINAPLDDNQMYLFNVEFDHPDNPEDYDDLDIDPKTSIIKKILTTKNK